MSEEGYNGRQPKFPEVVAPSALDDSRMVRRLEQASTVLDAKALAAMRHR